MKVKFVLIICLLWAGVLRAQKMVTIECRVGEGVGKNIQLFGVDNGQKKLLASASYTQNGYYGFRFVPEYEGFYVVGPRYGRERARREIFAGRRLRHAQLRQRYL